MKRLLTYLLLLVATATFGQDSQPDLISQSGNAFLRTCSVIDKQTSEQTALDQIMDMVCVTYIRGFAEGVYVQQNFAEHTLHHSVDVPFCLPDDGIEGGQMAKIVLKYIRDNPATAHQPTMLLAASALSHAFPCRSAKK
jgi:hypothetical protein